MQIHSSKVYEFVTRAFKLALLISAQLRRWYSKVPAEPGFTKLASHALRSKVDQPKAEKKENSCSNVIDEMAKNGK